jgi:hypothetical protein
LSLNNFLLLISEAMYRDLIFKLNLGAGLLFGVFGASMAMLVLASLITFMINYNKIGISGLRQNEMLKIKSSKSKKKRRA